MLHYGEIKDCKLEIPNKDRWRSDLLALNGKKVQLLLEVEKDKRTTGQNRLLWKYYELISNETGDDENSLHEFFKRKFLPPQFIKVMGEEMKIPASTTKLDKEQFSNYLMQINSLTGVPIPSYEA